MGSAFKKIMLLAVMLCTLYTAKAFTAVESYQNQLQGDLKQGDVLEIKDEKFLNSNVDWTKIHNRTVTNIITFGLYRDGGTMPATAFKCEIDLKVEYWSQPGQVDPITNDHVKLHVTYNPTEGVAYSAADTYKFLNGFKVKVTVNSITSAELGTTLPTIFRLMGQVVVERSYDWDLTKTIVPVAVVDTSAVMLTWEKYTGAEEYDLEWTFIDELSDNGSLLAQQGSNVTAATLAGLFRNNATRVTIPREYFEISLIHISQYLPIRIRPVQYTDDGFRQEGDWFYQLKQGGVAGPSVILLDSARHRSDLNWQYSAVYAEGGKKKEVVSYFDGTLRTRQTVTVNNSDQRAMIQETLYDEFGRPLVNILPAPITQSRLNYYPGMHLALGGGNYTYANVYGNTTDCIPVPGKMSNDSGAARYYSPLNPFLSDSTNKFIPDANGYPFAVNLYTPDNTGRMSVQGGVGELFQPGNKATKLYYGKPAQWELDRMFGNDVGYASHYLKNMVMDGNGQVSVSYLNAAGKTIATALAGGAPANLDGLPSKPDSTEETFLLIEPSQYTFDPAKLKLSATTTYSSAVPGPATLRYNIDKLIKTYSESGVTICSNCYYDLKIRVTDNCNRILYDSAGARPVGSLVSNCNDVNALTGLINLNFDQIGEYYVSFELGLNDSAIANYTADFIKRNTNLKTQWQFVQQALQSQDFSGCFSDCSTCLTSLGAKTDFTAAVVSRLAQNGVTGTAINTWSNTLYDSLLAQCQRLQASCQSSPCEDLENTLKLDVSPGGQYALFDGDSALERSINVLYNHWREEFPIKSATSSEYIEAQFEMEDGSVMSPYDAHFTLTMLLRYWKPEWAARFIKYHPEYCALRFCYDNSTAYQWDDKIKQVQTVAGITGVLPAAVYDKSNISWLVAQDTAFSGVLSSYKTSFIADLTDYSKNVVGFNASGYAVKNLPDYVDYLLYCADNTGSTNTNNNPLPNANNWSSCSPVSSCRIADLEWRMYRDKYLELKERYYATARSTSAYCGGVCVVGDTLSYAITTCPELSAFKVEAGTATCGTDLQSLKITYSGAGLTGAVTLSLYYPDEYAGLTQVDSVAFAAGQTEASICISSAINTGSILVEGISCRPDDSSVIFDCDVAKSLSNFTLSIQRDNTTYDPATGIANWNCIMHYSGPDIPAGASVTAGVEFSFHENPGAKIYSYVFTGSTKSLTYVLQGVSDAGGTIEGSGCSNPNPATPVTNNCAAALKYKVSRINSVSYSTAGVSTDTTALAAQVSTAVTQSVSENCEAQADYWMQQLEGCLNSNAAYASKAALLRTKLLQVCKAGGDVDHPNGASTVPGAAPSGGYVSFKEAIKGVLGITSLDMLCNPWLLDAPYPYNVKLQATNVTIQRTDSGICAQLAALTQEYNNAAGGFYQFLVNKFGAAMTLSEAELTSLQNGCNNCRYLLADEIQLPVFMDPGAQGYVSGYGYQQGVAAMQSEMSLDTTSANYESIYATYLNHRWGFTLSYADYKDFEARLLVNSSAVLTNQPVFATVSQDPYSCMKQLINHAALSGIVLYKEYIAEEERQFRKGYIAYCSSVKPKLELTALQQLYHFTLYYYDQAGNLVRTIPPEGVHLLDASYQQQVWDARDNVASACTYSGPVVAANKDTILNRLSTVLQAGTNSAMEWWLYNPAMDNNQVLATTGGNKYLFNTCISGRYLYMSIYTMAPTGDGSTIDFAISKHLVADLQAVLPLRQWTHVVLQGQGLNSGDLAVYVNGVLCPLSAGAPAGGCGWTLTNTGSGFIYPENLSTLKHFRLYNRLLSGAEIAANAAVPCLGLSPAYDSVLNGALSYWGRYNLPAVGTGGSTVEMQYSAVYPGHTLATSYGYQSLNGITQQRTPDAGVSSYWYDRLGRLVTSQNAEQVAPVNGGATGRYSYTKYDAQGRVIEVGEKSGATLTASEIFMSSPEVFLGAGSDAQITRTYYDEAYGAAGLNQDNLRKRVAATTYQDAGTTPLQASYYSYDQIGNVKTLWQQVQDLGVKQVDYQYDLVSGKVNKVRYQRGAADRFYYNYQYDAENRLTKAGSGIDSVSADGWEIMNPKTDAGYRYYLHGPLARMELGDMELVQGVDYAYTLQGWLKGVNGNYLTAGTDMGRDGLIGGVRGAIARDAYAYSLDYYAGDYKAIVDTNSLGLKWVGQTGDVMGRNLYNGNISRSTLALSKINSGNPVGYSYRYDQLNRLTAMRQHTLGSGAATWSTVSVGNAYKEDISYDGNGNILRYTRYGSGAGGKQLQMDSLKYVYARDGQGYLSSNRLTQVLDSIAGDPYTEDVSSQGVNNYIYDNIGNLITNVRDSIVNIKWTVYGKISGITKGDGSSLEYRYDAGGNRVYKGYTHGGVTDKTWYVRDAAGNVLAVYGNVGGGSDKYWKEQHLYGSSRLGLWEPGLVVGGEVDSTWNKVGVRRYELVNHLGNVLATVSDKAVLDGDHYVAEVMSAGDYYPFGMGMGDRKWSLGGYRYGFNGKENDNEVKGEGNEQDYGMRVYDPRLGRFLSVDPLFESYPYYTPYQFAGDNPIKYIDLDGLEKVDPEVAAFYTHAPQLDMTTAPGPANAAGFPRNSRWFWSKILEQHPEMFSQQNRMAIKAQRAPIVDEQWLTYNPAHAGYEGSKLVHHHIEQGNLAAAIPEKVHTDYFKKLHPELKGQLRGAKISSTLGTALGILSTAGDIFSFMNGNPESLMAMFPCIGCAPEDFIGRVQKDVKSELFYTVNSVSTQYEKGKITSKAITFDVYSDYAWDEDNEKYIGINKLATKTEIWNYDSNGNRTSTKQVEML
ncbi:RHS repeat-associated core domain-containing protein [Chitinophaga sancti]|uniref:RHS repeat-associated core domain-containing protein n=1 Tax=Chitinophaga sancti TaxID=1004 RepID=UPI002A751397|nr:RHS repeat-associated core domain-containing protein [Chitinophaga sancti]WPQ60127.1 RHS repeat-associated core domain-containing protein [Chitinophaga sancti]